MDADGFLHDVVDERGDVDYARALEGRSLDDALSTIAEADLEGLDEDHEYGFLINAYNLCTLDVVRRRLWGRRRSLRNPFWWVVFFLLTRVTVAGQKMSLYRLEFGLLKRHLQRDPRGHFALVCASHGCPPLRGGVYHGDRLDDELELAGKVFVIRSTERHGGAIWVNRIFKWYGKDFEAIGGVTAVLEHYGVVVDAPIRHLKYDWTLNVSRD